MGLCVRLTVQAKPGETWQFEAPARLGPESLADARALWEAEQTINRLTDLRVHVSLVESEAKGDDR